MKKYLYILNIENKNSQQFYDVINKFENGIILYITSHTNNFLASIEVTEDELLILKLSVPGQYTLRGFYVS